jgi:hypothetical protein
MTWYTINIAHQCNYLHHFHFITHCLFLISEEEFKIKIEHIKNSIYQGSNRYSLNAKAIRDEFTEYFNTNGQVEWQWGMI